MVFDQNLSEIIHLSSILQDHEDEATKAEISLLTNHVNHKIV